ncbi:MAG: diaminopimelate epimerase [Puniceicoccales bacterium]|jgi:diaminopimelate epimerase|nr:diaminopimelate epimerase [Puniceicoccales bacterium]
MSKGNDDLCFVKYHALGNDYLFLDASRFKLPTMAGIKKICHRNFGIGSDGILYGTKVSDNIFKVQIINPDGTTAEISGNGVRIFARAMFDLGLVTPHSEFFVKTFKKTVTCNVLSKDQIEVDMGCPLFKDSNIPYFLCGSSTFTVNGETYRYYPVSMGNPHCVIFVDDLSREEVKTAGPLLECNPMFPEKTNVQFAKILDRNTIAIEIWERGAGYTLASGSSACAVFAVARKLNLCSNNVKIHMPGGILHVKTAKSGNIMQKGPVKQIATCKLFQRQPVRTFHDTPRKTFPPSE